ncbi:MAG: hypothetical protein CR982_01870, partial [Candidatus Cloacimonadota bacterium]
KKIERKYLKRHLTKEEKENLVVMSMGKKNGNFGEKRSIDYKKAIEELYIDKYGNLLVCRESKDQFLVFDVFKEDSFVEKVKLFSLNRDDLILFANDKIYSLNKEKLTLSVFSY